jgi:hypothetical protein
MFDEGAKTDALHTATDNDMPYDALTAHVYGPVIAALTITQL